MSLVVVCAAMLFVAAPAADAACPGGKDCPWLSFSVFATAPDANHTYVALDVDQGGNVYTVLGGQSGWEVQIFDRTGNLKGRWPYPGPDFGGASATPLAIAAYSDGSSLYIADSELGTNEWSPTGDFMGGFPDQKVNPTGVATSGTDVVFTVDVDEVRQYQLRQAPQSIRLPDGNTPLKVAVDELGWPVVLGADNKGGFKLRTYNWTNIFDPHKVYSSDTFAAGADATDVGLTKEDDAFVTTAVPGQVLAIDNLTGKPFGSWSAPTGGLIGGPWNAVWAAAVGGGALYVADSDQDPTCSNPGASCPPSQIIRYVLGPRVSTQLAGPKVLRTTRAGRVRVPLSCQTRRRKRCKAKVAVRRGGRSLASRRAKLRDGRRRATALRLGASARSRLAHGRRLRVRVTAKTLNGGVRRTHRRIHVLAPP